MEEAKRARHAELQRAYSRRHPDRSRASSEKWRLAHLDRVAAASKKWAEQNPDKVRLYVARKIAKNLLSRRASSFAWRSNQRATRWGTVGRLSGPAVKSVIGPCAYCGGEALGWDHVMPLSRGGLNILANIVPACWPCNHKKGQKVSVRW